MPPDPPPPEVQEVLVRARALRSEGLDEESERVLRAALSRFPDDPEIHLETAVAILVSAPGEAAELIRRAIQLAPDDPWKLTRSASLMIGLAEYDDARAFVKRALKLRPTDFEYAANLLHLIGVLAWQKGNDELAQSSLETAFEDEPQTPAHGRVLAEFYASQGRPVDALRVLAEARRHRPDEPSLKQLEARLLAKFQDNERG
jgi:predicted Zn-dependent protease